jgi:hypothetical protein
VWPHQPVTAGAVAPCGSLFCSPETERRDGGRRQSPACSLPLVRLACSWKGFDTPSSALLASGAPQATVGCRVFLGVPFPGTCVPGRPLLEFCPSSEFLRLVAARARSPPRSLTRPGRSRPRDPPLLSFLLLEHNDSGRPVSPDAAREQPREGEGCHAPTGAVLRVGSLSTVLAAPGTCGSGEGSAVFLAPRSFAALFHAARVPGASLQSFPLSRSRARSREPLLPCGFGFDGRRRGRVEVRLAFTAAPTLCRGSP